MRSFNSWRKLGIALAGLLLCAGSSQAQTWTPLTNQPTFQASTAMQLTDGTVIVQVYGTGGWWKLTPDNTGSYLNGTWTSIASMPSGYGPLYYASAVLNDGRVIAEGGEYNFLSADWTNKGAIYDPAANTWTSVTAPSGWGTIGDAQGVILKSGTFMLANCCSTQAALFNATSLTWTTTGTGKIDSNDEEGWTLLPSGLVLTVDANNTKNLTHAEKYGPSSGVWSSAGSTIVKLPDLTSSGGGSHEIGPAVLRPNGTVWATGATGNTATYTPAKTGTGTWAVGPTFPKTGTQQLDVADGPAALLPSGNVLVSASPGVFNPPTTFYEYDGSVLTTEPATPNSPNNPSYNGRMLVLPTGQIFYTDGSTDVEIYTSTGSPSTSWLPTITSFNTTITHGKTYVVKGTQLNGLSQGAAYGDDAQSATNYPLVRITNNATGHVFYAKTHGHSTMGVATGTQIVNTNYDVPSSIETGASTLVVVANGLASNPVSVTVN